MENQNKPQEIEQLWERAVERAAETRTQENPLGEMLDQAAGLNVKTGVQAGLWGLGPTVTCEYSCGC